MTNSEVKQLEERIHQLQDELRRAQKEVTYLKKANSQDQKHWEANSASRDCLDFLLSHLPIVLWGIDREGRIMQFQGAGLEKLDLGGGEAYGQSLYSVLGDNSLLKSAIERALAGETFRREIPLKGRTLDCRFEPQFNAEQDVVGVRGAALVREPQPVPPSPLAGPSRISAKAFNEWEVPLYEWLMTFRDFVLSVDRAGTIRFINRTIPPLTVDDVIGTSIYDFIDKDRREEIEGYMEHVFASRENVDFEAQSQDPDGVVRTYECRMGPFHVAGDSPTVVVIARDVTELRRVEEVARKRQAELEHLSRVSTMGEMAAIMAHYLNNPLAAIANYAHGCIRRLGAEDADVDVEQIMDAQKEIVEQCNRSSDYIRHLRGFLQKREIRHVEIDLTDILIDAARLTEPELRAENLAVRIENKAPRARVTGDPLQIEQVLVNLLLNAADAMKPLQHQRPVSEEEKSPRDIVVRVEAGSENEIIVSVIDAGRGLTPGFEERIFEPFFTTQEKRLGMGLSVSKSIVESHGGRLEGKCNVGPGATFSFNLPRSSAGPFYD